MLCTYLAEIRYCHIMLQLYKTEEITEITKTIPAFLREKKVCHLIPWLRSALVYWRKNTLTTDLNSCYVGLQTNSQHQNDQPYAKLAF